MFSNLKRSENEHGAKSHRTFISSIFLRGWTWNIYRQRSPEYFLGF